MLSHQRYNNSSQRRPSNHYHSKWSALMLFCLSCHSKSFHMVYHLSIHSLTQSHTNRSSNSGFSVFPKVTSAYDRLESNHTWPADTCSTPWATATPNKSNIPSRSEGCWSWSQLSVGKRWGTTRTGHQPKLRANMEHMDDSNEIKCI